VHRVDYQKGISTMAHPPASTTSPGAAHDQSAFTTNFSEDERRQLLSEDRAAQLGISAILAFLIAMGMILGIISVALISYLGI
jgi:hypothetical protein